MFRKDQIIFLEIDSKSHFFQGLYYVFYSDVHFRKYVQIGKWVMMNEPGGSGMVLQRAGTHRATWLQVPATIISFPILVDVDPDKLVRIFLNLYFIIYLIIISYHTQHILSYILSNILSYLTYLFILYLTLSCLQIPICLL